VCSDTAGGKARYMQGAKRAHICLQYVTDEQRRRLRWIDFRMWTQLRGGTLKKVRGQEPAFQGAKVLGIYES
jgi:hypothetical protein